MRAFYLRSNQVSAGYAPQSTDRLDGDAPDAHLLRALGARDNNLVSPPPVKIQHTNEAYVFHRAFATNPLDAQEIQRGVWEVFVAPHENHADMNRYARYFCYVLRGGTNVGTIFGPAEEAQEHDTQEYVGRIHPIAGKPFFVFPGDRIALEIWSRGTAARPGYTERIAYGGFQDIADEVAVLTSPACKLVAPHDLRELP